MPTEIFPSEEISVFSVVRIWLVRIAILIVLLITFKNKAKNLDEKVFSFGTISAVIAAFLLFVYFQLGAGYLEIRHAAVFFVPLVLFAGSVLAVILPQRRGNAEEDKARYYLLIPAAVLSMMFFSYSLFTLYPNLAKRGDWARVAAYIGQNETPNQPVIVFQAYDALALSYHYKGANKILPDEKFFTFVQEDKIGSANAFRTQIDFVISKIPADAEEIWLLTDENCSIGETCSSIWKISSRRITLLFRKRIFIKREFDF